MKSRQWLTVTFINLVIWPASVHKDYIFIYKEYIIFKGIFRGVCTLLK